MSNAVAWLPRKADGQKRAKVCNASRSGSSDGMLLWALRCTRGNGVAFNQLGSSRRLVIPSEAGIKALCPSYFLFWAKLWFQVLFQAECRRSGKELQSSLVHAPDSCSASVHQLTVRTYRRRRHSSGICRSSEEAFIGLIRFGKSFVCPSGREASDAPDVLPS